jgi:hypothetical protein
VALKFMPLLERDWPDFVTEMKGKSFIIFLDLSLRRSRMAQQRRLILESEQPSPKAHTSPSKTS